MTRPTSDIEGALLQGELDIGFNFVTPDSEAIKHRIIGEEDIVVIARRGHPRVKGEVTLEQFTAETRVRVDLGGTRFSQLQRLLGSPVVEGHIVATVGQFTSLPGIVMETDALAVVPRSIATASPYIQHIQVIESPIPLFAIPVVMIWHERLEDDQGHRWLRDLLSTGVWRREPE